jgi:hypothetical protein
MSTCPEIVSTRRAGGSDGSLLKDDPIRAGVESFAHPSPTTTRSGQRFALQIPWAAFGS